MSVEFSRLIKIDHIDGKSKSETIEASADECAALATRFEVSKVKSVTAKIALKRQGDRMTYRVTGSLSASIVQECAVTAADINNDISEEFESWFVDQARVASFAKAKQEKDRAEEADEYEMREEKDDPERIIGGAIDVGELVAQYLALAIDPYLRAEGVDDGDYIEISPEDAKPNPFAALAALKDKT
ncbi:MAG: hypothetical protein COB76_05305 [Alphaproteobacteria bacterium]|nr:MAG: hypothetical protein COB76_05305 [Alphaproteobacteria bacterium]